MRGKRLYRRGDIIWWRRSIRLSDGCDLLIRLSLRTADPVRARHLGQLLMLSTGGVRRLVESLKVSHPWLTTAQLQRIAKTAFDETMAIFAINDMRGLWGSRREAAIEDHLDYYDWVAEHGGRHADPTVEDYRRFEAAGWSSERVDQLTYNISRAQAEHGETYNDFGRLAPMLAELGVEASGINIRAGLLALVQGHRDALVALQKLGANPAGAVSVLPTSADTLLGVPLTPSRLPSPVPMDEGLAQSTAGGSSASTALCPMPGSQADASTAATVSTSPMAPPTVGLRISDAMERCIADYKGEGGWSEVTCDQVRTAIELLLFVVGDDCPIEALTQSHLGRLMDLFGKLPNRYGRTREEIAGGLTASVARGERLMREDPQKVGLSQVTRKKHLTWIAQVIIWAAARGHQTAEVLDFKVLRQGAGKKARKERQRANAKRAAWTRDEIAKLLAAPIWTGCNELFDRFSPGAHVWHDAWYWAPLMIVLYGGRSSELVGLGLSDIHEDAPVPYFWIEFSELRDLKSVQSIRRLPIHPELIRLGFIDYVRALRGLGHTMLFPELHSPNSESFASTFYKSIFREWRAWAFPEGTSWRHQARGIMKDKDVHSFRGAASTLLKGRVEDAVRFDLLGHEGTNTTMKVYDEEAELPIKLAALDFLSQLTRHIEPRPLRLRPAEWQRFGKPRGRRRKQVDELDPHS